MPAASVAQVEALLASMSLEEKIGHLICPDDKQFSPAEWVGIIEKYKPGSVFFGTNPPDRLRECLQAIQQTSRIPVLVAADLEHGAGAAIEGATPFPRAMGLGAANDPALAREVGRATAREGRACGIHWTFSPVVDLARNLLNPITNLRALGDDPERVAALASAWIQGIQQGGLMAACAKHFPGDGDDDRDQHLCTSVNPCRKETWHATHGRVWREAIKSDVASIMAGHIALPAWEHLEHPADSPPATLSRNVQIGLLRDELGFEGVLVSDAAPMLGLTSRIPMDDACVANILAGSDVFLFANPREDTERLLAAFLEGRLSEHDLDQKVRRILRMKLHLGLWESPFGKPPSDEEKSTWSAMAEAIARKCLVTARQDGTLPLRLQPGAKIYMVNLKMNSSIRSLDVGLTVAAEALRERGFEVTVDLNPSHRDIPERARAHDAMLINFVIPTHAQIGTIRAVGEAIFCLWRGPWLQVPGTPVVFTTFGSPFHLDELPHLPNLLITHGSAPCNQRAAVAAWLGECAPDASPPVKHLFRPFQWL